MANIDKVIEVLCEDICKGHEQMTIKDLSDLTKSLSVLVVAKSKMGQSDINEIAFIMSSNILKQFNESKSGGTRAERKAMSDQDLHCIARLLQSTIFADSIFYGCQYCKYYNSCFPDGTVKNHDMHYDKIMKKLQDITGIDTSPGYDRNNLEAKFKKHKLTVQETLFKDEISINRVVERVNEHIKKELGAETPSLKELLDSLDKNLEQTVCREIFKIYYTTKDENIALEALGLLLKVAQHF